MSTLEIPRKGLVLPSLSDPGAAPALEAILQDIYASMKRLAEESNAQDVRLDAHDVTLAAHGVTLAAHQVTLDDHEARLTAGGL